MPPKALPVPRRSSLWAKEGITLVEVVISTLILTLGLVALLGATVDVSKGRAIAEQEEMATTVLSSTAETLQAISLEQVVRSSFVVPQLLGNTQGITLAYLNSSGTRIPLVIGEADSFDSRNYPNPLDVEITLSWIDQNNRAMSRRLTLLLGR